MFLPPYFIIPILEEERENRLENARRIQRRRKLLRDASNHFEMAESDFQDQFGLSRELAHNVCRKLCPYLRGQRNKMPEHLKVLVVLQYLTTGENQRTIGNDSNLALGQSTVSKYVRLVVPLISEHFKSQISFPSTQKDRLNVAKRFGVAGFPGLLGCLDCTHFEIKTPQERGEDYFNRRRHHSLNVQMICDSELKIIHIKFFPGRVNDQFIWSTTQIKRHMELLHSNRVGNFYLLGDSVYKAEPYLLTPAPNSAENTPQSRYNDAHFRTRLTIERAFGVMKARFRVISSSACICYEPEMASLIVSSCVKLHNMCQSSGMPEPHEKDIREAHPVRKTKYDSHSKRKVISRDAIIAKYFT